MAAVIFVCTGNTCRSPMAEAFARARFPQHKFMSRGLSVFGSAPASANASQAVKTMGYGLDGHLSTQLTENDVELADFIITMTQSQRYILEYEFPDKKDKISTLSSFAAGVNADVSDPYGGDIEIYSVCAREIKKFVDMLVFELK